VPLQNSEKRTTFACRIKPCVGLHTADYPCLIYVHVHNICEFHIL